MGPYTRALMETLTKEESAMLVMYYAEEATLDEIAAIYDVDPIVVQTTLESGKRKADNFRRSFYDERATL